MRQLGSSTPRDGADRPRGRSRDQQGLGIGRRRALLALGFFVAWGVSIGLLSFCLQRAEIEAPAIQGDAAQQVRRLSVVLARSRASGQHQIIMMGDSMLMKGKDGTLWQTVPAHLEANLKRRQGGRRQVKIYPYVSPGAGYSTFYFFADELLAARPDQIVMELNPGVLSRAWRTGKWVRTDLVAWLGAGRLLETLRMPLNRLGLTTDRTLWLVACVELGFEEAWGWTQRQQLRVVELYQHLQHQLATTLGMRSRSSFRRRALLREMNRLDVVGSVPTRRTAAGHLLHYRHAFEGVPRDDVSLVMLGATVRRFVEAGVPTLVYVTPINTEHMAQIGVFDSQGINVTLANAEAVVRDAGGSFIDLHDLLPDEAFRDASGHLTFDGSPNGVEILASKLTPHVILGMRMATPSKRGTRAGTKTRR